MATALTHSVNTFFAQVGEKVGIPTMVEYMKRFGFYQDPQLDLADSEKTASGPINSNGDLVTDGFDVGRVAIGQGGAEGNRPGDAVPDGPGRRDGRERRRTDEAPDRPEGHRPRWANRVGAEAAGAGDRDEARDRARS